MGKTNPAYPPEVKAEVVRLVREHGASLREAASTIGCTVDSVRDWVQKSMRDDGTLKDGGLTTDERAELNALRRKVRVLEQEKEILKKSPWAVAPPTREDEMLRVPVLADVVAACAFEPVKNLAWGT